MKCNILKKIVAGTMAAAIAVSAMVATPVSTEASTKFINKKVSDVTPKVVKFERVGVSEGKVTVKIPGKAVKLANKATKKTAKKYTVLSPKVEIRLGTEKGNKFQEIRLTAKAKASGKNTYTFNVKHVKLSEEKNAYISVSWKGNKSKNLKATNWSKLAKMTYDKKKFKYTNGGRTATETTYEERVTCLGCGKVWTTEELNYKGHGFFGYISELHAKEGCNCPCNCGMYHGMDYEQYNIQDKDIPSKFYYWVKIKKK